MRRRPFIPRSFTFRISLPVDALLLRHLVFEPFALLGHIDELAEAVRNLNPAGIKLEALGEPWLGSFRPGERRLRRRIFVKDDRPPLPEARFDLLDQHAAENVAPGIVGRRADAGGMRR